MRLRFTIRDLLWLTALIAMGVGWWIDRSNIARHAAESYAELEKTASVENYHKLLDAYTKLKLAELKANVALEKAQKNGTDGK